MPEAAAAATRDRRAWLPLAGVALLLAALALVRPLDHDESQYVAAAVLSAHHLLPYRDYPYLQTPLQPLALAPVAALAGRWTWPALRLVDAGLGAAAIGFVHAGARAAGARRGPALAAAGLMAACDPLLFGAGTARNDALPVACLSAALWLAMRQEAEAEAPGRPARRSSGRLRALGIGLLLAAAAAAKLIYLPSLVAWLLLAGARQHRQARTVIAGVLPMAALVGSVAWQAPAAAWFGTWTFPHGAPGLWYGAGSWRMSLAAKLVDTAKFLALGPALLALAAVSTAARRPEAELPRMPAGRLLAVLVAAGLAAAFVPAPSWRQYDLPALPPLFVLLALAWDARPPSPAWRVAAGAFAAIGLVPSVAALADAATHGPAMARAMRDAAAIRAAMDAAGIDQPVATLAPQYLPATGRLPDARFATGPFYFRARGLLDPAAEARAHLVSAGRLDAGLAVRPGAILVGGESAAAAGDPRLDAALGAWAAGHGYRGAAVPGTGFRLYVRPR